MRPGFSIVADHQRHCRRHSRQNAYSFPISQKQRETTWRETRAQLTGVSLENAALLGDLISASDAANKAFLHAVSSVHDREKLDRLPAFSRWLLRERGTRAGPWGGRSLAIIYSIFHRFNL